ncbi:MAG: hypothetical protein JST54_34270 [Deltaproteobacteria bacterium]|nr:hypothetical protein [Deltaproteobacteria bacterium]
MKRFGYIATLAALLSAPPARADFADHFARRTDVPYDKVPSRGHSKVLVIPIEVAGFPTIDMDQLRSFFGNGPGSFGEYWSVTSHGLYSVEATVADPVQYDHCPLPAATFPDCDVSRGDPAALGPAIDVMRDALSQVHARGVNFKDFDVNGATGTSDGTIDGFLLLTNTPFGGIALPIFEFNTGDNLDGGTGGAFVLDGVQVPYVAVGGEMRVLLHEFGHLLGFTDIYDENDAWGGVDLSLMGNWDYDANPPLLDAESRYRIGWAPTLDLDKSATVKLSPSEAGNPILKIGSDPEYFLVENRGPGSATDKDLSGRGIAIYHVDRSVGPTGDQGGFAFRLINCVECNEYHPYILNEVARGSFRWLDPGHFAVSQELYGPGDTLAPDPSGQPFSATHAVASTNAYDGGESTGITIEVLDQSGDDFDVQVTVPSTTPACAAPQPCPAGSVCPDERCFVPSDATQPTAKRGCGCGGGADPLLPGLIVVGLYFFFPKRASKAALAWSAASSLPRGPFSSNSK